jgi:hypothetical protein
VNPQEQKMMPQRTANKPNGHAIAPAPQPDETSSTFHERAAPDDAGGFAVASATTSVAKSTDPDACADAAPAEARGSRSPKTETPPRLPKPNGKDAPDAKGLPQIPPSTDPLPADGWEYVEAVHERVDLIALEVSLLNSQDEKVRQRELAYLRELAYGKTAPPPDDQDPRFVLNLPRPSGSSEDED